MGNVVDLLEYKKRKEEDEIDSLRKELADLIQDMGGIHVVPMMMQSEYCPSCSTPMALPPTFSWTPAECDFDYTDFSQNYGYDGSED